MLRNSKKRVYVLHVFEKKSQKTARADLELARSRLAELVGRRRAKAKH